MSDFRAIGGVSATLRSLLLDRIELPNGVTLDSFEVTINTPMETEQNGGPRAESPRINLFLYQVSESSFLKNQDMPGQGHPAAYGIPPLSLNLNYLITAHGSTIAANDYVNEQQAHMLLGSAMRVLHDYPVITDQLQTVRDPLGRTILHESLRNEFEKIKLCLDPVSLDDLSKIWTALTIPYRLSVAYSVSVVQIESQRARRYPRLVGEPKEAGPYVFTVPLQTPHIRAVHVRRQGDPPERERTMPYARIGDTLIILGENFSAARIAVVFNGLEIPVTPLSNQRIELVLPDDSYAGDTIPQELRLQPGTLPVEVKAGIEGFTDTGFRSNRAALVLAPQVTGVETIAPKTVTLTGTRLFHGDLNCQTLIGPVLFPGDVYENATPTGLTVTLPDVLPHRSVTCCVSQPIAEPFPNLDAAPEVRVTIGEDGPYDAALASTPTTVAEAAEALQAAICNIPVTNPAFKQARVTSAGRQLVILPGGLSAEVVIAMAHGDQTAARLGLVAATTIQGYLSGMLDPFPKLSADPVALSVTIGGDTAVVTLPNAPQALVDAATGLQTEIRAVGINPGFSGAQVAVTEKQLLIIPGQDSPIGVDRVDGVDDTSAAELQLNASYALRVRVNGAENIGDIDTLDLPL